MLLTTLLATLGPALAQVPGTTPQPFRVHGVLVDEAGQAVEGALVAIRGYCTQPLPGREFGPELGHQRPPPQRTDLEGVFSFAFEAAADFEFSLHVEAHGLARYAMGSIRSIPGRDVDLRTIELPREAVAVGYISDRQGSLLTTGWSVKATWTPPQDAPLRTALVGLSTVDHDTGQFRIAGLPPGHWTVVASNAGARTAEVSVTMKAGEEAVVPLAFNGLEPKPRLVVTMSREPAHPFNPAPGTLLSYAENGASRVLFPDQSRREEQCALEVERGPYRVELRDPRFAPQTLKDVWPGTPANIVLSGSAAVRLRVFVPANRDESPQRDELASAATAPVAVEYSGPYEVSLGYGSGASRTEPVRLRWTKRGDPTAYRGIVPENPILIVSAPGWPPVEVPVRGLRPNETRTVEARIGLPVPLVGRVVDHAHRPRAGIEVQATRGTRPGHEWGSTPSTTVTDSNAGGIQLRGRYDAVTVTDADGRFEFTDFAASAITLRVPERPWIEVVATVQHPVDSEVLLMLPPLTRVTARVILPEGRELAGLALQPRMRAGEAADVYRAFHGLDADRDRWLPRADGTFEPRLLEPGTQPFEVIALDTDGSGREPTSLRRFDVEVPFAAEHTLVFDLRQRLPEGLLVDLGLLRGAPASWRPHVALTSLDGARIVAAEAARRQASSRFVARLYAEPGTYRLRITAPGFRWDDYSPIVVERDAQRRSIPDVWLCANTVVALDAAGEPLVNAELVYWTDDTRRVVCTTDDKGCFAAVLPKGMLSVTRVPPPAYESRRARFQRAWGMKPPLEEAELRALVAEVIVPWKAAAFDAWSGGDRLDLGPPVEVSPPIVIQFAASRSEAVEARR